MNRIIMADKKSLVKKLVLLDGIGRAGKFFLGKIVSGLKNMEYFQYVSLLEHIPYMERLGIITEEGAVSLLRVNVDEHVYNMKIGRNLNLRMDDASSISNSLEKGLYTQRSLSPVSDNIVKEINESIRYSSFILHDSLPNIKIFFRAFPDMKWINLVRHPVDLVHSWHMRGWGHRFVTDPLSFIPVVKGTRHPVPWYTCDWQEEYERMTEIDRIIKSIKVLFEMGENAYNSLSGEDKKKILLVSYEGLVEKTHKEIEKMASFLNTAPLPGMDVVLTKERCPSELKPEQREKKMKDIKSMAGEDIFNEMMKLSSRYEKGMIFERKMALK